MAQPSRAWTTKEDETLLALYYTHTRKEIGQVLGRTLGSVRKRCSTLGLNSKHPAVTDGERELIRQWYTERSEWDVETFDLDGLAKRLNRTKAFVCRLARRMGLTSSTRSLGVSARAAISIAVKSHIAECGHPKGMLGKKHTEEFKQWQSQRVREWQAKKTRAEKAELSRRQVQTKLAKYGTGNPSMLGRNAYSRTKSGKRADLDNRFFRSSWEANYARYLNFLKQNGDIQDWLYEPQTFVFHGVTRGVLTYTPDFKIINRDGSHEWHEVKGWMDDKSKAKLKRMAKFYPEEKLFVIGADEYRSIAKWGRMFSSEWE